MKKICKITTVLITLFILGALKVSAASLNIVASTSSAIVGSSVIVTVKCSDLAGKFSLTSSNGSVLSGGASSVWIENGSVSYTFKANTVGTSTITIKPIDVADFSGNKFDTSKSITVSVKNKPVIILSGNNNLSGLSVGDIPLEPSFNKDTLEYSLSLEPETTSIEITATAEDNRATITGAGIREVTDGDNKLEVIITAENGTTKTYVINANVKEYDPIKVKIDKKEYTVVRKKSQLTAPDNYEQTTVKINEEDIPAFKSKITKYTLVALKDTEGNQELYIYDNGKYTLYKEFGFSKIRLFPMELESSKIPKNYKKTKIKYNDQDIVAYKLNENSKYALIYGMNIETGKTNIYMYDSSEDTLQRYNKEEIKNLNKLLEYYAYIIIGLLCFTFILVILLLRKTNKKEKNNNSLDKYQEIFEEKKEEISLGQNEATDNTIVFDSNEINSKYFNLEDLDEEEPKKKKKKKKKKKRKNEDTTIQVTKIETDKTP